MRHPIPSPRRPADTRPTRRSMPRILPRRSPLLGPDCPTCDHPSCRSRRAERLPRLGGHRAEFATEHTQAAQIQAQNRHLIIWWGEATQSFWVATSTGMTEAETLDDLLAYLWARGQLRYPSAWR